MGQNAVSIPFTAELLFLCVYNVLHFNISWIGLNRKLLLCDICQKQNTVKISMVIETNYIAYKTTQIYYIHKSVAILINKIVI